MKIEIKYEKSGNEYSISKQCKSLLRVCRNGEYIGTIGIATLASQLEARRRR